MRRVLLPAVLLATAAALPAHASYLLTNGCRDTDYRVVHLEAANKDIVEVCTDQSPVTTVKRLLYVDPGTVCDIVESVCQPI